MAVESLLSRVSRGDIVVSCRILAVRLRSIAVCSSVASVRGEWILLSHRRHDRKVAAAARRAAERPDLVTRVLFHGAENAAIILTILGFVDGALPQLQIALLGGHVLIPPYIVNGLQILCFMVMAVFVGKLHANPLFRNAVIFTAYIVFQCFYLAIAHDLTLREIYRSYLPYLLPMLLAVLVDALCLRISAATVIRIGLAIFVACIYFSIAQFFSSEPVLPTQSADGQFFISSWRFIGEIRAFSLFSSAFLAGLFYCLAGGIATAVFLSRSKMIGGTFLLVSAFCCYATLTRLTLFGFICCVVCAFVIVKFNGKWGRKFLPLYSMGASILVLARGLTAIGQNSGLNLGNTSSLVDRLFEWRSYAEVIRNLPLLDLLFGRGTVSYSVVAGDPSAPRNVATLPIDNSYLLITMHIGLVGLAFFVFFYWKAWERLLERTLEGEYLRIGCCAFWASIPLFALFNDPAAVWGTSLLLGLIVDRMPPREPAIDFRGASRATPASWRASIARA